MLTKLPDYIISDCGYPDWSVLEEKENIKLTKLHEDLWHTSSIWSAKPSSFNRLLPLRETITDYYIEKLRLKQQEHLQKRSTQYNTMSRNNCERPLPKQVNELINNAKRKQLQQPCVLDKRRSNANNSDNDLDQF